MLLNSFAHLVSRYIELNNPHLLRYWQGENNTAELLGLL